MTSACRGVALATSNPKRDQSYLADAVDIISMAQQLVPKTRGQRELARAQLMTSSNLLTTIPPPAVGYTSPGKDVDSSLLDMFCSIVQSFSRHVLTNHFEWQSSILVYLHGVPCILHLASCIRYLSRLH